jgi:hypothetical protein
MLHRAPENRTWRLRGLRRDRSCRDRSADASPAAHGPIFVNVPDGQIGCLALAAAPSANCQYLNPAGRAGRDISDSAMPGFARIMSDGEIVAVPSFIKST